MTETENKSLFDIVLEQTSALIQQEPTNEEEVHRRAEDTRPYKLALGSILSAGKGKKVQGVGDGRFVNLGLVEVLCRVQGIDPDEMRELYWKWQAEPDLKAGEVHNDVDVQA